MISENLDLTDPATFQGDLGALWQCVRETCPRVFWQECDDSGFWVVHRYADVFAAYRDDDALISQKGTVLDVLRRGKDSAGGRMLPVTDGQRHRALRAAMTRHFTPRALQALSDSLRRRTASVVRDAIEVGRVDFATDVADRLPLEAICDLMGIPVADRPALLTYNKAALSADSEDADDMDSLSARSELLMYLGDLVADRRDRPRDDIVSALVSVELDGEPLSEDDLVLNCYSLILGGDESTRMTAGVGVSQLARQPQMWADLKHDAGFVGPAVEEFLRWTSPSMHFARTAAKPYVIDGQLIAPGDVVTLWNTAANRDPEIFERPHTFDIRRLENPHLAFGQGPHFCVGARLAKLELTCLLEELRSQVASMEVTAEPQQVWSNFLFGYSSVPMELQPS